jgi:hypothetical protein
MVAAFALSAVLGQSTSVSAPPRAILESVEAAAAVAAPFFTGQDYIGFGPGLPALLGGYVRHDDILAWPLKFPTDHYTHMFVGAQKGSFPFSVQVEDASGKVIQGTPKPARTHDISFQPEAKKEYLLIIKPEGAATHRYSQIAAIVSSIGRGIEYKPSHFVTTAKRLIQQSQPLLRGTGYVASMNLFAVPLSPGMSSGPAAQEAGRTQTKNTMVVVSDGKAGSFKSTLRTPDGALAGSSRKVGQAQALKITVGANANGHPGAPLHLTNTSKAPSLFMGGIVNR